MGAPQRTQKKISKSFSERDEGQSLVSEVSEVADARGDPVSRGGKRYWLIRVRADLHDSRPARALAVGGKLAVFSFREEAESFLDNRVDGDGWWIEKLSTGELVASLCGPLSVFESVALDPIPELQNGSEMDGLLEVTRREFVWMICEENLQG